MAAVGLCARLPYGDLEGWNGGYNGRWIRNQAFSRILGRSAELEMDHRQMDRKLGL